jgi:signal peptidase II
MGQLITWSRLDGSRIALGTLGGAVAILDQTTKAAVQAMIPLHNSIEIIPGLLSFTHVHNYGVAFGFLNTVDFPFKTTFMTLVALTALIAIGIYAMRSDIPRMVAKIGLALVIGGATGNMIDRVSEGYVVDFVDFYWRSWHFWAFNVADAGITIGAALLILDMTWMDRNVSETI